MQTRKKDCLRRWELALLAALCITLLAALWADRTQQTLAGEVIRLHVIANSDSPEDQAEKLQLRDQVLACLTPLLRDCRNQAEALRVIRLHRDELSALGDVSVTLTPEYYPLRQYSTFALPAGRYMSLRVTIGEGAGQNWWCVVFPPLCTEALAEETEDAFLSLDEQSADLIDGQGPTYDLRFRAVDLWGRLREYLSAPA